MIDNLFEFLNPAFSSYLTGASLYLVLALLGVVIGFLAGMFGVGGGFLLVPCLNIFLGIPMEIAAGSVTCYIIGTSTTGMVRQISNGNVEFRALFVIAFGSMTGAVLGDMLQELLVSLPFFQGRISSDILLLIPFFLLLLVIFRLMSRKAGSVSETLPLQKFPLGPHIDLPRSSIKGISAPGLIFMGLGGGILTGLLGVSGGVLFMPLLTLGVGLPPHKASGTSLGIVLFASITAVAKKGLSGGGKVSLLIALALLAASFIGIQGGISVSAKLGGQALKRSFSYIVLLAAAIVLVKIVLGIL